MSLTAADFFRLPPSRVAVVLVDLQNDFCHPRAGGDPPVNTNNTATAGRANLFAAQAADRGAHVVYTRQILDREAMPERQRRWESSAGLCVKDTWGADLFVEPVPGSAVVVKHRFDSWRSDEFVSYLEEKSIDGLIICGVELVCCVLYAVLGAAERGYQYVIPTDLVSGQDFGDDTDNRAVRDYLKFNRPSHLTDAATILRRWADPGRETS